MVEYLVSIEYCAEIFVPKITAACAYILWHSKQETEHIVHFNLGSEDHWNGKAR